MFLVGGKEPRQDECHGGNSPGSCHLSQGEIPFGGVQEHQGTTRRHNATRRLSGIHRRVVESEAVVSTELRDMLRAVRRDVLSSRHAPEFDAGKVAAESLMAFDDAASVLDDLSDRTIPYAVRDEIGRAIIVQRQRRHHPLWASMLVAAFSPMLTRLRSRIVNSPVSSAELDQFVLYAFLEAIDGVDVSNPKPVIYRLKDRTHRLFMVQVAREQTAIARTEERGEIADETAGFGIAEQRWHASIRAPWQDEVVFLLKEANGRVESENNIRLMISTKCHDEEEFDEPPANMNARELRLARDRVKKQCLRTAHHLRLFFEGAIRVRHLALRRAGGLGQ